MSTSLLIIHVYIHVKPDSIDAFREATLANARASVREAGVVRFDVVQDRDDPARFALLEVYRDAGAHAAHRETAHYHAWRDAVADLMADARTNRRFTNVFPDDGGW
ncbi:MAG: putative quinol monooxygenase [Bacteroidota bacterium]